MPLTGLDVVRIWEAGHWERPVNRALAVLAVAYPERTFDELAQLSLRERDALLLAVRRQLVGPRLESVADCPACAAPLEFSLDSDDLGIVPAEGEGAEVFRLSADGVTIEYRLPNSADLAMVASAPDVANARAMLLDRCVIRAERDGADIDRAEIPGLLLDMLAADLEERDAAAEIRIELCCPECGHRWSVILDIGAYFWTELSAHARRLLREVDTLARTYGWGEVDILTMSTARRQLYLDMVLGI
jgi:hypothetical protein